jgi:hypothetical protein
MILGREYKKPPKPQTKIYTKDEYQKFANEFLALAKAKGMTSQNLAAVREELQKMINQRTKKPTVEKSSAPKKTKPKEDIDIER